MKTRLFLLTWAWLICNNISVNAQHAWNTTAKFTDSDGYISRYESSLNSHSGQLTVECWVKPATDSSNYTILGKQQFRLMTDNGRIRVQSGNTTYGNSNGRLPGGKWTHVAVTFNAATDNITVYLNGQLDKNINFTGSLAGTNDSLITGRSGYADNFVGELDEVRIWKTVRTQSEIQNNMRTHISWYAYNNYTSDLLYVQTFDFDVYSPGFYLPYGGVVGTMQSTVIGTEASTSVKHNTGMYFNGSAYLEATTANDPNISLTGPMTVELWVKPTISGSVQNLIDLTAGGSGGYRLYLTADNRITWQMNHIGSSEASLPTGVWSHITVVCQPPSGGSQVCNIYINGQEDKGYNYGALTANSGQLRIGASQTNTSRFTGYMDELRISNYAKTEEEIRKGLHAPVLYTNRPEAPRTTVAYNFDGQVYSGTRVGSNLRSFGARFSYGSESSAPLIFTGLEHMNTMDKFTVRNVFKRIPEEATAGFTHDSITISEEANLQSLRVFLSVSHANPIELRVELLSPSGNSVRLVNEEYNFYTIKDLTTIFDDKSALKISDYDVRDLSPVIAVNTSFDSFYNKNAAGVWRLRITDLANGNTGVLHSWGLQMETTPYNSDVARYGEEDGKHIFQVYPNPGNGRFKLNTTTAGTLTIYNMMGQTISSTRIAAGQSYTDLSWAPAGNYLFEYRTAHTVSRKKIVLER